MLEIYEVFDASNEELLSELQRLHELLRTTSGAHHVECKMLYDTVQQELEERGLSNKVFQQLTPVTLHASAPLLYGLPSPGPSAFAAYTTAPATAAAAAVVHQPVQPVAALYSFGSFGAGGNGGGAGGGGAAAAAASSVGGVSYSHGLYDGGPVANGSIAQAVNAMVTATLRQAQSAVAAAAGGVGVANARPPPPAALTSALPPPPPPAMQSLPRNHDSAAGAPPLLAAKQQEQPTPRAPPATLQLPPHWPTQIQPPSQPPQPTRSPIPATTLVQTPSHVQSHAQGPALLSPTAGPQASPGAAANVYTFVRQRHTSVDGGGGVGRSAAGPSSCSSGDEGGWVTDSTLTPTPTEPHKALLFSPGPETSSSTVGGNGTASAPMTEGSASGAGAGEESSGGGGGGGKQLSPWEAAMLAFQEEQRLIRKARKAIRKGQPAKPSPSKRPSAAAAAALQPPVLAAESSHGSNRPGGGGPRVVRPSATGSNSGLTTAAAPHGCSGAGGSSGALAQGPRGGGPASPQGTAALAASTAGAAAAAGKARGPGISSVAASATVGGKAGGGGMAGSTRGGAPKGGKPAAAGGTAAAAASPVAVTAAAGPLAATAARGAAAGTAAGTAAGPGACAGADADTVPEEQGLAARTQAVHPAEVAEQPRAASEPESVKTDEESSDLLVAAMREAAAARAAAPGGGAAAVVPDSDSEPESVSSSSSARGPPIAAASAVASQPGAHTAPAGPMGQSPGAGSSHTDMYGSAHSIGHPAAVRPGQPTLVNSSARMPPPPAQVVGIASGPRGAWVASASTAAAASASAAATPVTQQPSVSPGPAPAAVEVDTVATGSESGSDALSDSDSSSRSIGRKSSGGGQQPSSRPISRQYPLLEVPRRESAEEARQRAIAAAAAAAIRGRSASDVSAFVGEAIQLARAVVNTGPLKVDRWADWDLADSSDALSAWGTHHEEDPLQGGALRVRHAGRLAPPESLVAGPPGVHALAACRPVGSATASRQGQRQGVQSEGALARAGSAPQGGDRRQAPAGEAAGGGAAGVTAAAAGSRWGGSNANSSSDSSESDGGGAGSGTGSVRQPGGTSAAVPPAPLPRSGVVMAGSKPSALGTSSATTDAPPAAAAATAPSAPVRRPPLAPTQSVLWGSSAAAASAASAVASRHSATAVPSGASGGGGMPGLPRSGGGSCGSLATAAVAASPAPPSVDPSATASTAAPASAYLQCYSAFHEILTLCYSALPVMLDAAALSSASVATVAGGGGGGSISSRPPSRVLGAAAVAASGFDLMERYASLLARCEAWQSKLRQLTSAMPEDGSGGAGSAPLPLVGSSLHRPVQAHGPQGSSPWCSSTLPVPSPSEQHQQQPLLPSAARRYIAVYDDTAHPEVRNVVMAAMRLLPPGWLLDPADQVTDVVRPEAMAPDDDTGSGSCGNSRPSTAAFGAGAGSTVPPSSRAATPVPPSSSGGVAVSNGSGSGGGAGVSGGVIGVGGAGSGGGGGGGGPRCSLWNVLWSWSVKARVPAHDLLVWQRINHFTEARQLTRKDLLKKHLAKYQAMHNTGRSAALFDRLTPTTFVLPKEAAAFEEAFVRALHGVEPTCVQPMGLNLWIQKPVGLSRGRGISLINSLRQINTAEPMVVQRYLTDPLLVEGYKFDLRLYVLVTSFNPLEAWMYEEGFARFTTLPYTLDEMHLGNMHVHLTNSSVQRSRAEAGQLPAFLQTAEPAGGSKTSLATLRRLLSSHGVDWPLLWGRVCEVATAALFAAQDAIPHSPNSFELFGFDMMIDAEQKVWLLEVNSSPSMGLDTPLDCAVKPRLVADVLELLAPLPFDREALADVLRARTVTGRGGRRGSPGLLSGTASEERELCCADLQAVLGGALPRRYGEKPRHPGGFTMCLAPSAFHDRLLKLRRPLP